MNGIALTVLLSQLPKLFGFSIDAAAGRQIASFVAGVASGKTNGAALAVGAGTLAVILVLKRWPRVPGILIAVVGATVAVAAFDLPARRCGRPRPVACGLAGLRPAADPLGGFHADPDRRFAVALVSFADTSVLSRTYAARCGTPVDPNQEMVGLGAANLAAGFFQGFPISSSSSRTPVAEAAGARDPADRRRRRAGDRAAARFCARPAAESARTGAGRRRDRFGAGPDRGRRPPSDLSHPAMGVLAVDGVLRRRGGSGRHPGYRARDRHRRHRVPLGWLATAFGGAGPRRWRQGLPRHHALSAMRA